MLLQLDTIRGPHSTGMFGVDSKNKGQIFKKLGTPWEVSEYKGWDKFWMGNHNAVIGHNRYATEGGISNRTAHPFNIDHISGVHNGTIKFADRRNVLDDWEDFDVDSENIYHHMAKNGVDDTIKKLNGAYALVWHDANEGTINMVRNDARTLHFVYSKDEKTMFWASERWMLQVAANKCNVDIQEIMALKTDTLFSIPVPSTSSYQAKKLEGFVVRPVEPYKAPATKTYVNKWVNNYNKSQMPSKVTPIKKVDDKLKKFINQKVRFIPLGIDSDTRAGMDYIDCCMESDADISVRLYISVNHDLAEEMVDGGLVWTGVVRSYNTNKGESYVVIDPRSTAVAEEQDVKKK